MIAKMLPPPPDDEILIAAWHSQDSTRAIADELGLSGHQLDSIWRRLKRERKLPMASRQVGRPQPPIVNYDIDGRPSVHGKWFGDLLLDALRAAHGNDNETGVRADLCAGLKRK
jgi:hypothetical protein